MSTLAVPVKDKFITAVFAASTHLTYLNLTSPTLPGGVYFQALSGAPYPRF